MAEIAGILVDRDGRPVDSGLAERIIGIDHARLREIPETLGLAHGSDRTTAVWSAIRSGLISSLVTDSVLATSLLAEVDG